MKNLLALLIAMGMLSSPAVHASHLSFDLSEYPDFNPNLILSDNDIFNASAYPYDQLVRFLRSKGTLADRLEKDIDGVMKPAVEIIWRVSQAYTVNPKYLVVLLQKEQSLVEDPDPSEDQLAWATGYGVCDSCSKDDPDIQELRGFANQLEWAAKQHREKYLLQLLTSGLTIGGFGVGQTRTIDGIAVTPANRATAMLYSYTPHIKGNLNVWKLWNRWFRVAFPDGTLVRSTETNQAYLIRFGEKRPYASEAVLISLTNPDRAIPVSETDLDAYPTGPEIKFPKWALLREPNGTIYLYTGAEKRHIANMEAFRAFGFNPDEITSVALGDLDDIPYGKEITVDTQFPQGVVMRLAGTDNVFYVEDGVRHPIVDPIFLKLYFRSRQVQDVEIDTIQKTELGTPYMLHDGELIRSADVPTVYIVEHGELRPIPSEDIFLSVGWEWKSVVFLPDSLITLYNIGDTFDPDNTYTNLASSPL